MSIRADLLRIALPLIGTNMLFRGTVIIDTAIISPLGATAIAAVGVVLLITNFLTAIQFAVGAGGLVQVGRATGAGDAHLRSRTMVTTVALNAGIAVAMGVAAWPWAGRALQALSATNELLDTALPLLLLSLASLPVKSVFSSFEQLFQGAGETRAALLVVLGWNLLHVALLYGFVHGIPAIGVPSYGVLGVGIGALLSDLIGALAFTALAAARGLLQRGALRPSRSESRAILSLSVGLSVDRLAVHSMQIVFNGMVIACGVSAYAAHQIGIAVESISWLSGYAFGLATTALVSQRIGARDPQAVPIVVRNAHILIQSVMLPIACTFIFAPSWWMSLFTSDPEIIAYGRIYCIITAIVQIPLGMSMVWMGALRGLGHTGAAMWTTLTGAWFVRVPLAAGFIALLGHSIHWIWLAMLVDWVVRAALQGRLYRRRLVGLLHN